jgi:hypothetical protein
MSPPATTGPSPCRPRGSDARPMPARARESASRSSTNRSPRSSGPAKTRWGSGCGTGPKRSRSWASWPTTATGPHDSAHADALHALGPGSYAARRALQRKRRVARALECWYSCSPRRLSVVKRSTTRLLGSVSAPAVFQSRVIVCHGSPFCSHSESPRRAWGGCTPFQSRPSELKAFSFQVDPVVARVVDCSDSWVRPWRSGRNAAVQRHRL